MSTRIADLLIDLSKDPFRCEEFKTAPQHFIESTDLDAAESAVLLDGDSEAIGMFLAAKKKKAKKGTKRPGGDPDKRIPTIYID